MKKVLFMMAALALMAACGNNAKKQKQQTDTMPQTPYRKPTP